MKAATDLRHGPFRPGEESDADDEQRQPYPEGAEIGDPLEIENHQNYRGDHEEDADETHG